MVKKTKAKECMIVAINGVPVVVYDGMEIAKRGAPGMALARTWISIEPGYAVRDYGDGDMTGIEVEYSLRIWREVQARVVTCARWTVRGAPD
jgi:hypothetical protein